MAQDDKPADERARVWVRLPSDVFSRVQQLASTEERTINGQLTWLIKRGLEGLDAREPAKRA